METKEIVVPNNLIYDHLEQPNMTKKRLADIAHRGVGEYKCRTASGCFNEFIYPKGK